MTTVYLPYNDYYLYSNEHILPIGEIRGSGDMTAPHIKSYTPSYHSKTLVEVQKYEYQNGSLNKIRMVMNDGRHDIYDTIAEKYTDDRFYVFRGKNSEVDYKYELLDNDTHKCYAVRNANYDAITRKKNVIDYVYFDEKKTYYFVLNKTNPTFNGMYTLYYEGVEFYMYISDDGKNAMFISKWMNEKHNWQFCIKSKELIKRYGRGFITNDFLDSIFITGKNKLITEFYTSDDEFGGKMFELNSKSADHMKITFDDGETIKEDDNQILSIYVH